MIAVQAFCREKQDQFPPPGDLPQALQFIRVRRQFPAIPGPEFLPSSGIVSKPFAQPGAGRQMPGPFIQSRRRLGYAARPQAIDQNAIPLHRRIVDPPDFDFRLRARHAWPGWRRPGHPTRRRLPRGAGPGTARCPAPRLSGWESGRKSVRPPGCSSHRSQ